MPQYTYEVGVPARVTALGTGVKCMTSAPAVLIGIGVATVLTGQFVQLWHGNATTLPVVGTMSLASNTYTQIPADLPSGFSYCVTNEDADLTIYWMPSTAK